MFLSVVMFPLIASLAILIFGRLVGGVGAVFVALFCSLFSFILASFLFYEITVNRSLGEIELLKFATIAPIDLRHVFYFDTTVVFMLFVVALVSLCVQIYSAAYMKYDPHLARFMAYLSLFTFFMYLLITSSNLIQLFIGWEGVGLCSYLLISFWFTRTQANTSSIKAFIVNRVGDMFFILGLTTTTTVFYTLSFLELEQLIGFFYTLNVCIANTSFNLATCLSMLFFAGAMSKSAQIFLHTWLPDAMEGPTPVSALIHAATMVAAGVFLLIKLSFVFSLSPLASTFVVFVGAITAVFASLVGLFQNDIKKIIAYSTCSQLGYMFVAIGFAAYSMSFFHLFNHAFFKALLFLTSGSVIHSVMDNQDIRRMGGLVFSAPLTYCASVVGSAALLGIPFFAGWYSKDPIIETAYFMVSSTFKMEFFLILLAALFTAAYSTRMLYLVFLSESRLPKGAYRSLSPESVTISLVLFFLIFCTLFLPIFFSDMFYFFWSEGFFHNFSTTFGAVAFDVELKTYCIKTWVLLAVLASFFFTLVCFVFFYNSVFELIGKFRTVYIYIAKKLFFDSTQVFFLAFKIFKNSFDLCIEILEKGFFEKYIPNFAEKSVFLFSAYPKHLQTGFLYNYLLMFVGGTFFLLLLPVIAFNIKCIVIIFVTMFVFINYYCKDDEYSVVRHFTANQLAFIYALYPWLPGVVFNFYGSMMLIYGGFYYSRYDTTPFIAYFI